ncbi:MAG: hypothetical protein ACP59X_12140 [Solidesulfovibrio sp. DCME]|uniref:hypothetical protein n=1 Tax=Solidesulfovibrio sp. DCME TaxID=3447380 RepID=UPI003D0C431B
MSESPGRTGLSLFLRRVYPAAMTDPLFDPLAWLATKSVTVSVGGDGNLTYHFNDCERPEMRARIRRVVARYEGLLWLQLDVAPGVRPRTVRQLLALGRLRLAGARYDLPGRPPANPRAKPWGEKRCHLQSTASRTVQKTAV